MKRRRPTRWGLGLFTWGCLLFFLVTINATWAQNRGRKETMDTNKGQILLAGLVYSAEDTGANTLSPGINAIPGAKVVIVGTNYETQTDGNGMFVFTKSPEGDVEIEITAEGYRAERRTARVDKGATMPPNLRIEMMAPGTQYVGKTPTGLGTLYVAYSQRIADQSQQGKSGYQWDSNLQTIAAAMAAGADPMNLETNYNPVPRNPKDSNWNPVNQAPNSIMIMPPNSPSRTGFHNMTSAPYWLAFDGKGQTLYVANAARQIQVLDATHQNRLVANLPVQGGGVVTSLSLSGDQRHVMATVMAVTPGVMMIDTESRAPAAFLAIDKVGTMSPTGAATGPDGSRVYVTLSGQGGQSGKGLLVALDPYSGMTVGRADVGNVPTDVVLSKDGRLAYVANSGSGSVTVVDAWSMAPIGTLNVGVGPQKLAITPDGNRIFVTNKGSDTVTVINPMSNSIVGTIPVGKGPMDVAVSPDGSRAYVSNKDDGTISVLDAQGATAVHVTDPMPRSSPFGIAVRPGGG